MRTSIVSLSRLCFMFLATWCTVLVGGVFSPVRAQAPVIIYVKKGSTGTPATGSSWSQAYPELQQALVAAAGISGPKEIWVAAGIYQPTTSVDRTISFDIPAQTSLYGGFAGTETVREARNSSVNRTVLSGDLGQLSSTPDDSYHVVVAGSAASGARFDGFVVTQGNANDESGTFHQDAGAGMLVVSTNGTLNLQISNCEFVDNVAMSSGGGLALISEGGTLSVEVSNSKFNGNRTSWTGGGMFVQNISGSNTADVINCVFSTNRTDGNGGGLSVSSSTVHVLNSSFSMNYCGLLGGAVYGNASAVAVENSILWGNYKGAAPPSPLALLSHVEYEGSTAPVLTNNSIQESESVASEFVRNPDITKKSTRTSIIPVTWTPTNYPNQWVFSSGPKMPGRWAYRGYMDHKYKKFYITGRQLQAIDMTTMASTLYPQLDWGRMQRIEKSVHEESNKIYFASHNSGLVSVHRITGDVEVINPLAEEPGNPTYSKAQDVVIDNTQNLLYAPVFSSDATLYGLLEWDLANNTKRWITESPTSTPVQLATVHPEGDDNRYWNGHRLFWDEVANVLYYSMGNGVWWWNRNDNTTGVYSTTPGSIPLQPGNPGLPSNKATSMFIDYAQNKFYIGTHMGLFVWDRNTNTSRVYNSQNSKLETDVINNVDKNEEESLLYVACEEGGFFTINTLSGEENIYMQGEGNETDPQLMDSHIASVYYDDTDKKLYVSTDFAGIWVKDYANPTLDYGDLRLKKNSSLIDRADPATFPTTSVTKDIDGNDRVQRYYAATPENSLLDLGAYEGKFIVCPEPVISAITKQGVSCHGAADGSLSFAVSGGVGPYTVRLQGGNLPSEGVVLTSYSYSGLTSGVYTITAAGVNGCTGTTTVSIDYAGAIFSAYCEGNVGSTVSGCDLNGTTMTTASAGFTVTKSSPAGGTNYTYRVYTSSGTEVVSAAGTGTFGSATTIAGLGPDRYRIDVTYGSCSISTADAGNQPLRVEPLTMQLSAKLFRNPDDLGTDLGETAADFCTAPSCGGNTIRITPQLDLGNVLGCQNLSGKTKTFKLFKENAPGEYDIVVGTVTNNASFSMAAGTLVGKYKLVASLQDYGCAPPLFFEIKEPATSTVTLLVSPETCLGANDGTVEISASGSLISPVRYELYHAPDGDACNRVLVPEKVGSEMTGLSPGKYCVKIVDRRGDAGSCKCHAFEIYRGNYKTTPALAVGEKRLWPYTVAPKSALTASHVLKSCGADVTAQFGTPPYKFVWKREVQEKRLVLVTTDPEKPRYVPVLQTVEYNLQEETNMEGKSSSSELKSGQYKVYVTDRCSTTPVVVSIVVPIPARTYNLCFRWKTGDVEDELEPKTPIPVTTMSAIAASSISRQLQDKAAECLTAQLAAATEEQKQKCLSLEYLSDEVELTYNLNYFHYTLYYYDRVGALVRTVAPKGVKATATDRSVAALRHDFVTQYAYNTMGQPSSEHTPDVGQSEFIYNAVGQLRFSQTAKQKDEARYDYTKYDDLGRIIDAGENDLSGSTFPSLSASADVADFPSSTTLEHVSTYYSIPAMITYQGKSQQNLLNRVSYSATYNKNGKVARTYYSYDAHGNVDWLEQDIPGLTQVSVGYTYDLVSGIVLQVALNEHRPDQFYQRYQYNEDKLLTLVETSRDGYQWDRDARYVYYDHGSLRSAGIGEDHIQKRDYIYTLQGWLKGINTPDLSVNAEEGADKLYAQDKFGMGLGYYQGDFYRTYNGSSNAFNWKSGSQFYASNNEKDLFNGNVSSWISKTGSGRNTSNLTLDNKLSAQVYTYDRLGRITSSKLSEFAGSSYQPTYNYGTEYSYDPNGNILALRRNGNEGSTATWDAMDNLSYVYNPTDNKLQQVVETAHYTAGAEVDDVKSGQVSDNYVYDKAGNLIEDKQAQIYIQWNVFGKVSEVKPYANSTGKKHVVFTYDAQGNRLIKEVIDKPYVGGVYQRKPDNVITTYYVRDGAGTLLGVYERRNEALSGGSYKANFTLQELPLYGGDRLGQLNAEKFMGSVVFTAAEMDDVRFDVESLDRKTKAGTLLMLGERVDGLKVSTATKNSNSIHAQVAEYDPITNKYQARVVNSFAGDAAGNIALAEDTLGNIQAYSITAEDYWGRLNACLAYDRQGNLMPSGNGISANPKAKSMIIKQPGTSNYLLITLNTANRLMYHVLDMSLTGNSQTGELLGDVTIKNQDLDVDKNVNYGSQLWAVEDRVNDRTILYATRYIAPVVAGGLGTKEIVSFTLTDNVLAQKARVLATLSSLDKTGDGSLHLDDTGKNLLVVNYGKMKGWTWQRNASLHVFRVNANLELQNPDGTTTSVQPVNTITIAGGSLPLSAEFSIDGSQIVYGQRMVVSTLPSSKNEALWSVFMRGTTPTLIQSGIAGEIRRGKDNRLHVAEYNSTSVFAFAAGSTGLLVSQPTGDVTLPITSTGFLANVVHKIYSNTNLQEAIFARTVGLKRYELKDHLSNVTAVVSDVKRATLSGLVVSNEAEILSYSHYYPFGMQMPGRTWVGENVADGGYRYGFHGKEKDKKDEWGTIAYDYGFRIYNPAIAKFLSVDPLTSAYPWYTPYQFAGNTPIMAVDLEGLEPKEVVTDFGKFTKPAIRLLSLVSGETEKNIAETSVGNSNLLIYSLQDGGGGVTFKNIYYTHQYFNGGGSDNIEDWIDISSHEVGHLAQYRSAGGTGNYLRRHVSKYVSSGSHDGSPLEEEAEKGRDRYRDFIRYLRGTETISNILKSEATDEEKLSNITILYKNYVNQKIANVNNEILGLLDKWAAGKEEKGDVIKKIKLDDELKYWNKESTRVITEYQNKDKDAKER